MPDNTGKLRAESGLGPVHKLGSGHETKYFYGVPKQSQLNRLFGTDVGWAEHYKRNMVVDPNGQIVVSYTDLKGNVVATSLVDVPIHENLTNLDSYTNAMVTYLDSLTQYQSIASIFEATTSFVCTNIFGVKDAAVLAVPA